MAKLDSLEPLLIEELKDLLDAETQLIKALPKMASKASSEELRLALEEHLEQTKQQVGRLNQAFSQLDVPAKGKKCVGMQGVLEEGEEHMKEDADEAVRDAVIIGAAQRVEHYEIAAYGTARTHAQLLGHDQIASLLEQTLEEEKETDEKLTEIAESLVNPQAAEAEEEGGVGARRSAGRSASDSRPRYGASGQRKRK